MMAASHSELNYHLTLKIPHLFSTFLTEIFLTFGMRPLPVLFLFLLLTTPHSNIANQRRFPRPMHSMLCKHNMATTRFRPLPFKDGRWVPGSETTKSQRCTEIFVH